MNDNISTQATTFSEYCEEIDIYKKSQDKDIKDMIFGETYDIDFSDDLRRFIVNNIIE